MGGGPTLYGSQSSPDHAPLGAGVLTLVPMFWIKEPRRRIPCQVPAGQGPGGAERGPGGPGRLENSRAQDQTGQLAEGERRARPAFHSPSGPP